MFNSNAILVGIVAGLLVGIIIGIVGWEVLSWAWRHVHIGIKSHATPHRRG